MGREGWKCTITQGEHRLSVAGTNSVRRREALPGFNPRGKSERVFCLVRRQRVLCVKMTRDTNQDRDELAIRALTPLKAIPGRVKVTSNDMIEGTSDIMTQHAVEDHAVEARTGEQDEVSHVTCLFCCAAD